MNRLAFWMFTFHRQQVGVVLKYDITRDGSADSATDDVGILFDNGQEGDDEDDPTHPVLLCVSQRKC